MVATLSVNLNAIAWLRNRRNLPWPNLVKFGRIALQAGAAGLTVHPRPDQRHIRFTDVADLYQLIREEFPEAEFNIEGYPTEDFLNLAEKYANQITLVPDEPSQTTSDHGWDFASHADLLAPIIQRLKKRMIRVSLFADPVSDGLEKAKALGADRVEFYTGPYGATFNNLSQAAVELEKLRKAALTAQQVGLDINAGHDLTLENLPALASVIPFLREVSIGHGLVADALEYGMRATVQHFKEALS